MAQTPARDFIRDAVVDFRFYGGTARNHANNANALVWTSNAPIIQPAHGVPALLYIDGNAPQSWMAAAQTEVTFEALISADMLHLGPTASEGPSFKLLAGDWNVGLYQNPDAGFTSYSGMYFSFNGDVYPADYFVYQPFISTATAKSLHKGSPLHLVISARYTAGGPLLEVATMVNGVYDTGSTNNANHTMTAAPTNALFDTTTFGPTYFVRMWDAYVADAQVFADLHREARKVLPSASFEPVAANGITFNGIA